MTTYRSYNARVNIFAETYSRYLRPGMLFLGMLTYVLFTWTLLQNGLLQVNQGFYWLFIPLWVTGLVFLTLPSAWHSQFDRDKLVLWRALWCNLGAITLAILVPHTLRLLLLIVPVFGIIYVAIHLALVQVLLVVFASSMVYAVVLLYLAVTAGIEASFELLSAIAYLVLVGATLILARDVQMLRDNLLERNGSLRAAMERLQEMALRDGLTGVYNRRAVMEILERQKGLADRNQQGFTLCFADLDHFKSLNDRFGHAVGDMALRRFTELAGGVIRSADYVARFGGEEFLLVLVDADERTAQEVAQRLAERTRNMWIPGTDDNYSMTVSVGISRYCRTERIDDVINRADEALFKAKRAGRDTIVVSESAALAKLGG